MPNISLKELLLIKSKVYLFQVFGDIPEHFHSFQKYAQFLYDGIVIEEPEYTNHFSNFGLPAFDASIFNHQTPTILGDISPYTSLISLHNRLYEFSFIGSFGKPGRVKMIEELKKKFKNIFVHDSSLGLLSKEELNNIIKNIYRFFVEILNELRLSSKFSQLNLNQKEKYIVNFKYCKYLYFRELKEILKSNSNILNKLKQIIKSTKKILKIKIFFL